MTKDFTREEFSKYIRTLDFKDLGDVLIFVRSYLDFYKKADPEDKEAHYDAFSKYLLVMAEFGPTLLMFSEMILEANKLKDSSKDAADYAVQSKH